MLHRSREISPDVAAILSKQGPGVVLRMSLTEHEKRATLKREHVYSRFIGERRDLVSRGDQRFGIERVEARMRESPARRKAPEQRVIGDLRAAKDAREFFW
jgi:hypothetical protein